MGLEMRAQSRVTALAVLVFCAGGALGAQAPLEAYGKLPTLSNIVLSPDGGKIAFLRSDDQGEVVVAEEVGAPKPLSLLDTEQQKVRSLEWADDDHLIIVMNISSRKAWTQRRMPSSRFRASSVVADPASTS
jgi:hypothetical protein